MCFPPYYNIHCFSSFIVYIRWWTLLIVYIWIFLVYILKHVFNTKIIRYSKWVDNQDIPWPVIWWPCDCSWRRLQGYHSVDTNSGKVDVLGFYSRSLQHSNRHKNILARVYIHVNNLHEFSTSTVVIIKLIIWFEFLGNRAQVTRRVPPPCPPSLAMSWGRSAPNSGCWSGAWVIRKNFATWTIYWILFYLILRLRDCCIWSVIRKRESIMTNWIRRAWLAESWR